MDGLEVGRFGGWTVLRLDGLEVMRFGGFKVLRFGGFGVVRLCGNTVIWLNSFKVLSFFRLYGYMLVKPYVFTTAHDCMIAAEPNNHITL